MHVNDADAPADVEYVPTLQLMQLVAPVKVTYVPAPQLMHALALAAE